MPLHTFVCTKCGSTEEILIPLSQLDKQKGVQRCECDALMRMLVSIPNLVTDTDFMKRQNDDDGLPDQVARDQAHAKAKAAGVNIQGKKFHPGLCRRGVPFDPLAWYGDRAEVVAKTEKLGRVCEGSVNHTSPVRDEHIAAAEAPYQVSEDVVAPYVDTEIDQEHGGKVSAAKRREITAKYVEKHSGDIDDPGPVNLAEG